jgi:hypothetical protein
LSLETFKVALEVAMHRDYKLFVDSFDVSPSFMSIFDSVEVGKFTFEFLEVIKCKTAKVVG